MIVRGAQDVTFSECRFGMNFADDIGGAVQLTGSSVFFRGSQFYQNKAASGGAIALGPISKAFILDTNFTREPPLWGRPGAEERGSEAAGTAPRRGTALGDCSPSHSRLLPE